MPADNGFGGRFVISYRGAGNDGDAVASSGMNAPGGTWMFEVRLCPECGVPRYITSEHSWLSDGSIVLAGNPEQRMAFVETENFDPLYQGISNLIGLPIGHILTDSARRSTLAYMNLMVSDETRRAVVNGEADLDLVFATMFGVGRIMGYGNPSLLDMRYEHKDDDFVTILFRNPISRPVITGAVAGTVEAYLEHPRGVTYKEAPPDAIEVTVFEAEHPAELKNRLRLRKYQPAEGNFDHARCATCGGPANLSRYDWDTGNGIIRSKTTGRRFALIGPPMVDAVFEELENELGKAIPEVVVEAQRRFVRNGFYAVSEIRGIDRMREQFARRGLGLIRDLDLGRGGVHAVLENATLHLMTVGLTQGLYELATGEEGKVEWKLSEDRRLEIDVRPWK